MSFFKLNIKLKNQINYINMINNFFKNYLANNKMAIINLF